MSTSESALSPYVLLNWIVVQLNWVECDESNTESAILDSNRRISVEEVRDSLLQAQLRCSQLNQQLNVLGLDDEDELELEPAPEVHRIEEGDKIEAIK